MLNFWYIVVGLWFLISRVTLIIRLFSKTVHGGEMGSKCPKNCPHGLWMPPPKSNWTVNKDKYVTWLPRPSWSTARSGYLAVLDRRWPVQLLSCPAYTNRWLFHSDKTLVELIITSNFSILKKKRKIYFTAACTYICTKFVVVQKIDVFVR